MAKVAIVALTRGGCQTALRLGGLLREKAGRQVDVYVKAGALPAEDVGGAAQFSEKLADLIARIFPQYDGFVMIMAAGIVFRTLAPYAVHKSQDPAVVVMDEQARFAISLLAGHLGGANRLAAEIAAAWGAPCQAVITTATDVRQKPAFDLLAQANDCRIANLSELKYISSALVNGGRTALLSTLPVVGCMPPEVVICEFGAAESPCPCLVLVSPGPAEPAKLPRAEHILHLIPRQAALGVGCKRGTPAAALLAAAEDFLAKNELLPGAVKTVASVELKKDEPGILALAEHYQASFVTFGAVELQQMPVSGQSDFVRRVTGTPSVAEAAALLAAGGAEARLLAPKTVYPGITLSLAVSPQNFEF